MPILSKYVSRKVYVMQRNYDYEKDLYGRSALEGFINIIKSLKSTLHENEYIQLNALMMPLLGIYALITNDDNHKLSDGILKEGIKTIDKVLNKLQNVKLNDIHIDELRMLATRLTNEMSDKDSLINNIAINSEGRELKSGGMYERRGRFVFQHLDDPNAMTGYTAQVKYQTQKDAIVKLITDSLTRVVKVLNVNPTADDFDFEKMYKEVQQFFSNIAALIENNHYNLSKKDIPLAAQLITIANNFKKRAEKNNELRLPIKQAQLILLQAHIACAFADLIHNLCPAEELPVSDKNPTLDATSRKIMFARMQIEFQLFYLNVLTANPALHEPQHLAAAVDNLNKILDELHLIHTIWHVPEAGANRYINYFIGLAGVLIANEQFQSMDIVSGKTKPEGMKILERLVDNIHLFTDDPEEKEGLARMLASYFYEIALDIDNKKIKNNEMTVIQLLKDSLSIIQGFKTPDPDAQASNLAMIIEIRGRLAELYFKAGINKRATSPAQVAIPYFAEALDSAIASENIDMVISSTCQLLDCYRQAAKSNPNTAEFLNNRAMKIIEKTAIADLIKQTPHKDADKVKELIELLQQDRQALQKSARKKP